MKRKFVITGLVLMLAAILGGALFYAKSKSVPNLPENKALESKIEELMKKKDSIDLREINDFEWDKLYIVSPYIDPKKVLSANGVNWISIETSIIHRDDINLLIFTNKGIIVSYVNFPRDKGDFYPLARVEFEKDKAVFQVEKAEEWIHIKAAE